MINVLHVSGNPREAIEEFHKANPHAKVKFTQGVVETFSIRHYFRKIKTVEDASKLQGINFNSLMFWGMAPSEEIKNYLWSRLRESVKKDGNLTLHIPSKEEA